MVSLAKIFSAMTYNRKKNIKKIKAHRALLLNRVKHFYYSCFSREFSIEIYDPFSEEENEPKEKTNKEPYEEGSKMKE